LRGVHLGRFLQQAIFEMGEMLQNALATLRIVRMGERRRKSASQAPNRRTNVTDLPGGARVQQIASARQRLARTMLD
jgi:hypothetical protein